jgi:WD40 repeat protein/uncharacterized caspase-like protein
MQKLFFLFLFFCGGSVLAQEPKLMLPIGHSDFINRSQFSPDGKYVITYATSLKDKNAIIWETFSGKKIQSLSTGDNTTIQYARFSNDNKYILLGSENRARIWETRSYNLIAEYQDADNAVFSPDNNRVLVLDNMGNVAQVNLKSLKTEMVYKDSITNIPSFSNDGKLLYLGSPNSFRIYEVQTGKILFQSHTSTTSAVFNENGKYLFAIADDSIKKIDLTNGYTISDFTTSNFKAYFSKNNKYALISLSFFAESSSFWDVNEMKQVFRSDTAYSIYDTLAKYDPDKDTTIITTGKIPARFPYMFNRLSISNDGHYLAAQNVVWDMTNPQDSYELPYTWQVLDISNDNRFLLVDPRNRALGGYTPDKIYLWDISLKKIVQSYLSNANSIKISDITADGKNILIGYDSVLKIVDAKTAVTKNIIKCKGYVLYAAFTKNGEQVLVDAERGVSYLADAVTGKTIKEFKGINSKFYPPFVDQQGKIILEPMEYDTVLVEDPLTMKQEEKIVSRYKEWKDLTTSYKSHNGRYLLQRNGSGYFTLKDVQGKYNRKFEAWTNIFSFSADDKRIFFAAMDSDLVNIWDIETGKKTSVHLAQIIPMMQGLEKFYFTPDNKHLLITDAETAMIYVLDAATVKMKFYLEGEAIQFSADNKYATIQNHGACDIYDFENKKLLYKYISVDDNNYLVTDAADHYDGTEASRKLLYFTCGEEVVELDQVKDQLWIPHLAERIMRGDSINAPAIADLRICGLTPQVERMGAANNSYDFMITPRRGGLGETALYLNGIEVKRYKQNELVKTEAGYELHINKEILKPLLIAGQENTVTIKAFTAEKNISSRGVIVTTNETKKITTAPNLYAVMIGISDYKGDELDLKFAAKDANAVSKALASAARKLLNTDGREHVFTYNLTTDTDHYLLPEKNSIRKTLSEIGGKATANDILFIFFAGHGIMKEDTKQFYFLTADASKASATDAITDVGVSTAELSEWMKPENIKAQKRILIFDACNSGQLINDFIKIGTEKQNYLAARNDDYSRQIKAIDKLNEESGFFILSASASNQSAYEMGRYAQGLLTYSLLKGIKQQPEILEENKYLNISRWFDAAKRSVTDLSKENGARQEPQIVSNTNFNIGVVDKEVIAGISLPQEKLLFAGSNFQNSNEKIADDDLELNGYINEQLTEISTRGAESKIAYISFTNSPDAYTLTGRYTLTGDQLTVKVNLKQNKQVKYQFVIKGNKKNMKSLAGNIVRSVSGWVLKNQ